MGVRGRYVPIVPTVCVGLPLMKTAQTTSYRIGDDGYNQAGRADTFFLLQFNNYFGHKQRFSGTTGGYYDQATSNYKDVNGNATTKALAFPDAVIIDWSTWDEYTGSVLWYYFHSAASVDWDGAVDWAWNLNHASKTDWRIVNRREMENLIYDEIANCYEYEPILGLNGNLRYYWSGTYLGRFAPYKISIDTINNHCQSQAPSVLNSTIAVRTGNISEL